MGRTEARPRQPEALTTAARVPRSVPEWHSTAACREWPELDWIEAKPGSAQAYACRLVCSVCPGRLMCALGALERGEPHGIWGGLDRADRAQVARACGFPKPGVRPEHGERSRYVKWGCRCSDCRRAHAVYEAKRRATARRLSLEARRLVKCDRAKYRRRMRHRAKRH